ncbi:MAG: hypothetical protein QM500_16790 [Methylococcales bacterium]
MQNGICDQCGSDFIVTESGVNQHIDDAGFVEFDLDGDHVAYQLKAEA